MSGSPGDNQFEELSLSKAAQYLLEECRMVLPGIQALFGFQLIAVLNAGFDQKLTDAEQIMHLGVLGLIAISGALVMTPASIHRQTGATKVTKRFIETSTRLLLWSMVPLCLAICVDFYLIARVILQSMVTTVILAGLLFVVFVILWFILPRTRYFHQPNHQ